MALILLTILSSAALGGHYPWCARVPFLSQCLLHSSHTSALLAWEAPDYVRISACLCVWGWNSCRGARGLAWTCTPRLISWWGGALWCQNVILYYHVEFVVCCSVRNTDWVSVNFPVVVEPIEPFCLVFPHHSVKWQKHQSENTALIDQGISF